MEQVKELENSFKNFVYACHKYISLPNPTDFQYGLCDVLQNAPTEEDRLCIQAWRGASKSHIVALYCVWILYKNKEEKILVVSATEKRAIKFVKFCKQVIHTCPFLSHMIAKEKGLASCFDVKGCVPSQTPSLQAKGITAQITGDRATTIIADDLEIATTKSVEARDKIEELSSEFEDILVPDLPNTLICWLGTPHSSSSVYNRLPNKGYSVRKYPIYVNGVNQEPTRFPDELLEKRRLSKGDSLFQLQYMLSTSLVDKEKFPLKLGDIIYSNEFNHETCSEEYVRTDIKAGVKVNEAKGTDLTYSSISKGHKIPMSRVVMSLDPAGGGNDEFAWTIAGTRNGYIFRIDGGAWHTGLNRNVLMDIKSLISKYNVNDLVVEINYGGDTLVQLLKQEVNINIIPIKNTKQKESRIISTLEPLLNQRKLVVNDTFFEDKELLNQFCNITPERGALKMDDRLDSLEMAVSELNESLSLNLERMKEMEEDRRLEANIRKYSRLGRKKANWSNI